MVIFLSRASTLQSTHINFHTTAVHKKQINNALFKLHYFQQTPNLYEQSANFDSSNQNG